MHRPSVMRKRSALLILLLHTVSISEGQRRGNIFMGYRGKRTLVGPNDESLNTMLPGKPRGDVGVGEFQGKTTATERSTQTQTAMSEDDTLGNLASDSQSGMEQLFEVSASHQDQPGPFRILTSLLRKTAGFVDYLSHPNVALSPFLLLNKLKRKFYQHLRDKLNLSAYHHEDYPIAYKFGNA